MDFSTIIHAADDEPTTYIVAIVLTAQIIGRSIPDHVGGLLGIIRYAAKVIGMYNGYGGKSDSRSADTPETPVQLECGHPACPFREGNGQEGIAD